MTAEDDVEFLTGELARAIYRTEKLLIHIARLEGTDIDTARTRHLPPEGDV